ncbi:MAG TPA: CreA family protein [Methyloceanibacter sp.]|nr:CreA family protein [Methyloceanibacter sp.]
MRAVLAAAAVSLAATGMTWADDFPCVSTTFNLLSPNDKVGVSDFDDPDVPGVTCFISQARTGGWGQPFGLNEDPSNFSVSCRQSGPITADISKLPAKEEAFTEKTSIFFKRTRIYRIPDVKRNAIIYLAVSSKLINGSPANAISVVPIMAWPK